MTNLHGYEHMVSVYPALLQRPPRESGRVFIFSRIRQSSANLGGKILRGFIMSTHDLSSLLDKMYCLREAFESYCALEEPGAFFIKFYGQSGHEYFMEWDDKNLQENLTESQRECVSDSIESIRDYIFKMEEG